MIIQVLLAHLFISTCGADSFASLYNSNGEECKATVCVSSFNDPLNFRTCPGVICRKSLIIVADSCVKDSRDVYVQKGINNCTIIGSTQPSLCYGEDKCIRHVVERNVIKDQNEETYLGVLRVNWPYSDNYKFNYDTERQIDSWMEYIYELKALQSNRDDIYKMSTGSVKIFLWAVVLPTVSYILCFMLVIFYTGTSEDSLSIPYEHLKNEETKPDKPT